jgi:hypothetical protein
MRFVILLCLGAVFGSLNLSTSFYKAFKSESLEIISNELEVLKSQKETSLNNAYIGALTMKKSSQLSALKEKLEVFKIGHSLLEKEISSQPGNIEYRFLRLVIQEKSPKILKYNSNIEEDKSMVIEGFNQLPTNIKQFIRDYCSNSLVLKSADLID